MKIKDSRGFTLIELLVSISILSIMGLALFSTINTSIKTNKKNEEDIKAMHLAQSEMENLRVEIKNFEGSNSLKDSLKNKYDVGEYTVTSGIEEIEKKEETEESKLEIFLYEINITVVNKKTKKQTKIITRLNTCVKLKTT